MINSIGVLRRRSQLSPQYHAAFLIYLLSLSAAHIIHSFWYCPELVFTGLVLSALSMFGIILFDQIEQYMRQQRKIAQHHGAANEASLHLQCHDEHLLPLCQGPQKAQQVTLDFTTYLRKNFTAIASEDAVPFADELEHTRAYLAVKQVQFEDSLAVRYDILHEDFRLPPLTLQPIVENAVKHGMDPEYAPLRITIRTRQTDSGSEISVEDNGPGFAPADNQEPHIALANIRERLQMQGGKLAILPREEGGTIVKVIIPDRELPARQLAD